MSAPNHVPGPYTVHTRQPTAANVGSHQLQTSAGVALATLPFDSTHSREACLATAHLFAASPALLAAARVALPILQADLKDILEAHCNLTPDLEPRIETLEPVAQPCVDELTAAIEALQAAIALAEPVT